ncbi:DUF4421 domain-containing protein [Cytophaga hutchinsonii]|jgi:hypothetical protein|uniref:DUF4421 domain-containing protein n=1 Tax=Cytophaga hutchinsonii (strain ATCC 33406 / DSM 1761 / CIP 103989 / NBRC 15051 / NCIMB 9469 / D465) TaxID=269798 RepID=A0A6N4SQR3_CYTH3|nr:DUF4421 domain-containing protein [Cytophaga hutchinsonii]ABG58666.1 conserved hypothetical protein [Cytophaga hutchinsonii ATCC 33406]SFX59187.1 protein of unknown function [Cytophaga hutchinsonii ATCC 33406]
MCRFIFSLFFLIQLSVSAIAQQNSEVTVTKTKPRPDTNYIKSYKHYLTIGIFVATPINTLTLTPKDSTIKPTQYSTNLASAIGFTGSYKSISGSFAFRASPEADETSKYGTTKYKSFSLGTQRTRFSIRFDYRKVAGFYNGDSIIASGSNPDTYFKRSDVNIKQFMLSGLYNFSWKKYSYQSSFLFSEHQLKTRVGFIMKSSISLNRLQSDSSLINLDRMATDSEKIQQLNFTSFLVGPGMGLNVVVAKRVYFSLMIFYSLDFVTYTLINNNNSTNVRDNSLTGFYEGRVALGYHSKRFYAGLKFTGDKIAVQTQGYTVENSFGVLTLDLGYRFVAPGILKKVYAKTLTKYLGL